MSGENEVPILITAEIKDALNKIGVLGGGFKKLGAIINTALWPVAAVAAALAAVTALGRVVASVAATGEKFYDLSQQTSLTAEQLSKFDYIATQSGSSLESLVKATGKASVAMYSAAGGSKESNALFQKLNVTYKDSTGKLRAMDDVLRDISVGFSKMASGPEKTALAIKLFGRAGAELIPTLNEMGKNWERMSADVDQFGLTITTKTAVASDKLKDSMASLGAIGKGFGITIANELIPPLADLAEAFVNAYREGGWFFKMLNWEMKAGKTFWEGLKHFGRAATGKTGWLDTTGYDTAGYETETSVAEHAAMLQAGYDAADAAKKEAREKAKAEAEKKLKAELDRIKTLTKAFADAIQAQFESLTANILVGLAKGTFSWKGELMNFLTWMLDATIKHVLLMMGVFKALSAAIAAVGIIGGLFIIAGLMAGVAALAGSMKKDVPKMAEGGIVTSPTLAMVGESGPEAVIPLDKLGDFGSQEVNVYMNEKTLLHYVGRGMRSGRLNLQTGAVQ